MNLAKRIELYADYFAKAKLELAAMKRFEYEMHDAGRSLLEESFEYNGYIHRYNTYVDGVMRHWIALNELGLDVMEGRPPLKKREPIAAGVYVDLDTRVEYAVA